VKKKTTVGGNKWLSRKCNVVAKSAVPDDDCRSGVLQQNLTMLDRGDDALVVLLVGVMVQPMVQCLA